MPTHLPTVHALLRFLVTGLATVVLFLSANDAVRVGAQASPPGDVAQTGHDPTQKDTEPADEDLSRTYTDYFEAHDAAFSSNKHVLVYRFEEEAPAAAQVEFEEQVLQDAQIREQMGQQFVFVKLAEGEPIQVRSTAQRTGYVRRRFRRVQRTWTETVWTDVFEGHTNDPGILIVRVTGEGYRSGAEAVAYFPFGPAMLNPHVFKRERTLEPWKKETFGSIVSTPLPSVAEYLSELGRALDLPAPHSLRSSTEPVESLGGISYDYDYIGERIATDRVTARINLGGNGQLTSLEGPIDARVDVYSLRDSRCPVQYVYRKLDPTDEWQDVEIGGLAPETAYRLSVYFYSSDPGPELIGEADSPLYATTCGPTRIAKARALIAMQALSELNDWNTGRVRGKNYIVGRWCERFYSWTVGKHVKTFSPYGYDARTFSQHDALISGRQLRRVARKQNIMGDHIRISNHGFMALSYDEHLNQVWTIEGNFGNRVVLHRRYVQDYWSVGTLVEGMLKVEAPASPEEVATTEETAPQTEVPERS